MRVNWLQLNNFRSFSHSVGPIELGPVNVFVGPNNSGKSSILKALHLMQAGASQAGPDVRVGSSAANIQVGLSDLGDSYAVPSTYARAGTLSITISTNDRRNHTASYALDYNYGGSNAVAPLPDMYPNNFIVPHFSKRKANGFHEDVRAQYANQVFTSMQYLSAKLAKVANPTFPAYESYSKACEAILGFVVTAVSSDGGLRPGVYLPNGESLSIEQMGEGVPNIVSFLADLALYKGKLFLIEEPENDLHPHALKGLLEHIVVSSQSNQFVISTHSNVVVRHLGALSECRIYKVDSVAHSFPVESSVNLVANEPLARLQVLRDLGYSLSDFELWDGWLILEEASAERIIRDYLIPLFAPALSRVRTLSAGGVSKIEPVFEDFNRLARFSHLEDVYRFSSWVRVDGDDAGRDIVRKLRESYSSWDGDRFSYFAEKCFEAYYPSEFSDEVTSVLSITDKQQKDKRRLNSFRELGRGLMRIHREPASRLVFLQGRLLRIYKRWSGS